MQPTTHFRRNHSPLRVMATLAVLGLVLVHARPSAAEPSGALEQLPPPRACTLEDSDGILCADGVGLTGANDVAFSPDGKNVYVPSLFDNAIAVFARNPANGFLTQLPAPDGCLSDSGDGITCTPARGLSYASAAVVSRDGRFVYVGAALGGITVFARDQTTGRLTQLDGDDGCLVQGGGASCGVIVGPIGPRFLALSPDGNHLYASSSTNDAVGLFARDKVTGTLTQLPAPTGCIAENGDGIACTDAVGLNGARGMAVSRDGKQVYVASFDSDTLAVFARDRTTGALTQYPAPLGCLAENGDGVTCTSAVGLNGARAVAISKTGRQVYVVSQTSNAIAIFARNARTGTLSQLAAPDGCLQWNGDGITCNAAVVMSGPTSIALSKDGKHAYVTAVSNDAVVVLARDKTTGVLTQLPGQDGCVSATGNGGTCESGLALNNVFAIGMPENGKHVYATSYGNSSIAAFARAK